MNGQHGAATEVETDDSPRTQFLFWLVKVRLTKVAASRPLSEQAQRSRRAWLKTIDILQKKRAGVGLWVHFVYCPGDRGKAAGSDRHRTIVGWYAARAKGLWIAHHDGERNGFDTAVWRIGFLAYPANWRCMKVERT
jgi:hypothetical protein